MYVMHIVVRGSPEELGLGIRTIVHHKGKDLSLDLVEEKEEREGRKSSSLSVQTLRFGVRNSSPVWNAQGKDSYRRLMHVRLKLQVNFLPVHLFNFYRC